MNRSGWLFRAICSHLKKNIGVRLRFCIFFIFLLFKFLKCQFFNLIIGLVRWRCLGFVCPTTGWRANINNAAIMVLVNNTSFNISDFQIAINIPNLWFRTRQTWCWKLIYSGQAYQIGQTVKIVNWVRHENLHFSVYEVPPELLLLL